MATLRNVVRQLPPRSWDDDEPRVSFDGAATALSDVLRQALRARAGSTPDLLALSLTAAGAA